MKNIILIALLLSFKAAFPQPKEGDTLRIGLNRLIHAKIGYEKFEHLAKKSASRYSTRRDSAHAIYLAQVQKIKRNGVQYLEYINNEIKQPETRKERLFYNYFNTALPFDPNKYLISERDLYLVIKRSLLEENKAELPKTLDDISFSVKRDYYPPFKLQTNEDIFKKDIKIKSKQFPAR